MLFFVKGISSFPDVYLIVWSGECGREDGRLGVGRERRSRDAVSGHQTVKPMLEMDSMEVERDR